MSIHPTVQSLLDEIETFLSRTGTSASAFGMSALGDPRFIGDLRTKDRSPSLRTVEKVRAFMRDREERAA